MFDKTLYELEYTNPINEARRIYKDLTSVVTTASLADQVEQLIQLKSEIHTIDALIGEFTSQYFEDEIATLTGEIENLEDGAIKTTKKAQLAAVQADYGTYYAITFDATQQSADDSQRTILQQIEAASEASTELSDFLTFTYNTPRYEKWSTIKLAGKDSHPIETDAEKLTLLTKMAAHLDAIHSFYIEPAGYDAIVEYIEDLTGEINTLDTENDELKGQVLDLKSAKTNLEAQRDRLNGEVGTLQLTVGSLESAKKFLEEEAVTLESLNGNLEGKVVSLESDNSGLEGDIASIFQTLATVTAVGSDAAAKAAAIKYQISAATTDVALDSELESIPALRAKIDEGLTQLTALDDADIDFHNKLQTTLDSLYTLAHKFIYHKEKVSGNAKSESRSIDDKFGVGESISDEDASDMLEKLADDNKDKTDEYWQALADRDDTQDELFTELSTIGRASVSRMTYSQCKTEHVKWLSTYEDKSKTISDWHKANGKEDTWTKQQQDEIDGMSKDERNIKFVLNALGDKVSDIENGRIMDHLGLEIEDNTDAALREGLDLLRQFSRIEAAKDVLTDQPIHTLPKTWDDAKSAFETHQSAINNWKDSLNCDGGVDDDRACTSLDKLNSIFADEFFFNGWPDSILTDFRDNMAERVSGELAVYMGEQAGVAVSLKVQVDRLKQMYAKLQTNEYLTGGETDTAKAQKVSEMIDIAVKLDGVLQEFRHRGEAELKETFDNARADSLVADEEVKQAAREVEAADSNVQEAKTIATQIADLTDDKNQATDDVDKTALQAEIDKQKEERDKTEAIAAAEANLVAAVTAEEIEAAEIALQQVKDSVIGTVEQAKARYDAVKTRRDYFEQKANDATEALSEAAAALESREVENNELWGGFTAGDDALDEYIEKLHADLVAKQAELAAQLDILTGIGTTFDLYDDIVEDSVSDQAKAVTATAVELKEFIWTFRHYGEPELKQALDGATKRHQDAQEDLNAAKNAKNSAESNVQKAKKIADDISDFEDELEQAADEFKAAIQAKIDKKEEERDRTEAIAALQDVLDAAVTAGEGVEDAEIALQQVKDSVVGTVEQAQARYDAAEKRKAAADAETHAAKDAQRLADRSHAVKQKENDELWESFSAGDALDEYIEKILEELKNSIPKNDYAGMKVLYEDHIATCTSYD
jgi:hypothetical protein